MERQPARQPDYGRHTAQNQQGDNQYVYTVIFNQREFSEHAIS